MPTGPSAQLPVGLLVPALPTLGELFGASPARVQLTLVAFAVAFATGQLVFGPLSDRRGRRTALLIGAGLTLAGSLAAALGFVQMLAAAAAAVIQGLIYDGTVYPMAGLQLVLSLAAWTVWRRLRPEGA